MRNESEQLGLLSWKAPTPGPDPVLVRSADRYVPLT
jgi:hypothetical protein